MKRYKLQKLSEGKQSDYVIDLETGEYVNITNNAEYLAWIAEGNTPESADA